MLRRAWFDWRQKGRPQQQLPPGNWNTALFHPGRGWGKTDTGSHAVKEWDESGLVGRIALVGATAADVRDVMVLGESGILAAYPRRERPWFRKSLRCVDFHRTSGCKAFLYSAEEPERLRGPQHHKGWGDELAAWANAQATLNQLKFGMRLGRRPQTILTTTPKAVDVVERLVEESRQYGERVVVVRGSTFDNAFNLPDEFLAEMVRSFGGTRLGQQELEGEILTATDGLFRQQWFRYMPDAPAGGITVVGVDPAITSRNDETGIVVVRKVGDRGYVLEDLSGQYTPEQWARTAVDALRRWKASHIVAETNRGGDLVQATIHALDRGIVVKPVRANRGKDTRAEPVAALYEQGRIFHREKFEKLEKQMVAWNPTSQEAARAARQSTSPDRMDALVWAVLDLGFHRGVPRFSDYGDTIMPHGVN